MPLLDIATPVDGNDNLLEIARTTLSYTFRSTVLRLWLVRHNVGMRDIESQGTLGYVDIAWTNNPAMRPSLSCKWVSSDTDRIVKEIRYNPASDNIELTMYGSGTANNVLWVAAIPGATTEWGAMPVATDKLGGVKNLMDTASKAGVTITPYTLKGLPDGERTTFTLQNPGYQGMVIGDKFYYRDTGAKINTWVERGTLPSAENWCALALPNATSTSMIVAEEGKNGAKLYLGENSGAKWTDVTGTRPDDAQWNKFDYQNGGLRAISTDSGSLAVLRHENVDGKTNLIPFASVDASLVSTKALFGKGAYLLVLGETGGVVLDASGAAYGQSLARLAGVAWEAAIAYASTYMVVGGNKRAWSTNNGSSFDVIDLPVTDRWVSGWCNNTGFHVFIGLQYIICSRDATNWTVIPNPFGVILPLVGSNNTTPAWAMAIPPTGKTAYYIERADTYAITGPVQVKPDGVPTLHGYDDADALMSPRKVEGGFEWVDVPTAEDLEQAVEDAKAYTDAMVVNVSHDAYKEVATLPDPADAEDHVMYLIKITDNPPQYEKYVINDEHTDYIDMGKSTDINLQNYRTAALQDIIDAQETTDRNNAIAAEATARTNADNAEATAREDGDADTLENAKEYTDDAVATKEDAIEAGTISQFFRGDKTWVTLNKSNVGLSNVDNTSDANKPISTATQTALDGKEPAKHIAANEADAETYSTSNPTVMTFYPEA
jgi:hypothetical protein